MGGMDNYLLSSSPWDFFGWWKMSDKQTVPDPICSHWENPSTDQLKSCDQRPPPVWARSWWSGRNGVFKSDLGALNLFFFDGDTEHKKDLEIQKLSLNTKVTLLYRIIWRMYQRLQSLVQALWEKALLSNKVSLKTVEQPPCLSQFSAPHTRLISAKVFQRETSQLSWPMKYLLTMCKVN